MIEKVLWTCSNCGQIFGDETAAKEVHQLREIIAALKLACVKAVVPLEAMNIIGFENLGLTDTLSEGLRVGIMWNVIIYCTDAAYETTILGLYGSFASKEAAEQWAKAYKDSQEENWAEVFEIQPPPLILKNPP